MVDKTKFVGHWILLKRDTDCVGCHYTISKGDGEGMYQTSQGMFCSTSCYQDWKAEQDAP